MSRSKACFFFVLVIVASAEARLLVFQWDVKEGVDSNNKQVIKINGKTPGPIIQAQRGDTIVVKVTNSLRNESLAIRWQGIRQIGTPCNGRNGPISILTGGTCAYRLVVDRPGKFVYQSVYQMQNEAGLHGEILVLP